MSGILTVRLGTFMNFESRNSPLPASTFRRVGRAALLALVRRIDSELWFRFRLLREDGAELRHYLGLLFGDVFGFTGISLVVVELEDGRVR